MDVFKAIQKRKSTHSYEPTPVPEKKIAKLLEAARLAPSANNLQPWHFIVVTDGEKKKELSKGISAKFLAETPVVIVACGDTEASPDWCVIDVAIAVENMALTATGEGLGTCWVGCFDEDHVRELLRIPKNFKVVILLAVGYARQKVDLTGKTVRSVRQRKALGEIASFEEYGQPFAGQN